MKNISGLLLVGCSALALAGCGPNDISSPGTSGDVIINPNPTPVPTPGPTPTPGVVTPAATCPTITGVTNAGTIAGPTGEWRVCALPRNINASITLPKVAGVLYRMSGRVDVGCDGGFLAPSSAAPFTSLTVGCSATQPLTGDTNVTLTIEPGVIVYSDAAVGQTYLVVNRGNKIRAEGTAALPIIFTSELNVRGQNTDTSQQQWGGVVLLGRAPTTDCASGGSIGTSINDTTCERETEGATGTARFGGRDRAYDAGVLKYVQLRYSGFNLTADSELQALTGGGVGTGTTLDYIQVVNSSDDGAEFFGGAANMKHYIAVGSDDDSLDVDTGAQLNLQYAILAQRAGGGDSMLEIGSNSNPNGWLRTKLNIANFTFVKPAGTSASNSNNASMFFRGATDTQLVNGVLASGDKSCVRMNGSGTVPATLAARSVVMQCGTPKYVGSGTYTADQVQAQFGPTANNNSDTFTATLTNTFVNGGNESGAIATDPKTISSVFDTTTWVGAVRNAADTWYANWTCNNATANFGTGNSGACTSLPTT